MPHGVLVARRMPHGVLVARRMPHGVLVARRRQAQLDITTERYAHCMWYQGLQPVLLPGCKRGLNHS